MNSACPFFPPQGKPRRSWGADQCRQQGRQNHAKSASAPQRASGTKSPAKKESFMQGLVRKESFMQCPIIPSFGLISWRWHWEVSEILTGENQDLLLVNSEV